MILSWALILGPTEPFGVLPCPTGVPRISKMYFWNILINIDNFYFHCHGQFSLYKFSKTHSRTDARLENSHIEVGRAHLTMFIYRFGHYMIWKKISTDRQTDRQTDRPTDKPRYRSSLPELKNHGPDQKFCKRNIDFAIEYLACESFCMYYFNWQLLYITFLLGVFVCTIPNVNFCMHYYNSRQLLYVLLQLKALSAAIFQ